jgi:hypothetical protein
MSEAKNLGDNRRVYAASDNTSKDRERGHHNHAGGEKGGAEKMDWRVGVAISPLDQGTTQASMIHPFGENANPKKPTDNSR